MAKTITLTCLQRLKLRSILEAQVGTAGLVFTIGKILSKIELNAEDKERVRYNEAQIGDPLNGNLIWRVDTSRDEPYEVSLEDTEHIRLRAVLQQWDKFSPLDADWFVPVASQMDIPL